jgi:hypothetical protein
LGDISNLIDRQKGNGDNFTVLIHVFIKKKKYQQNINACGMLIKNMLSLTFWAQYDVA